MGMSVFAQTEAIPPLSPHFSALIVEDIDKAIEWYQNTLGLELINKTENADFAFKQANLKRDAILIELIEFADVLYKLKEEIYDMLDYINIILLKKAKKDYIYTNCIKIVENTKKRLQQNANYDMCIDNLVFNIWEEVN